MFQRKRISTKRKHKRRTFLFISTAGILVFVLSVVALLRIYVFRSPLYISPLPLTRVFQDPLEQNSPRKLKELLEKEGIVIASIQQARDAYVVKFETKEEVLFSPDKDLTEQIASLQVILPRLTMEGKRFTRLDLRYDKPVVVFVR